MKYELSKLQKISSRLKRNISGNGKKVEKLVSILMLFKEGDLNLMTTAENIDTVYESEKVLGTKKLQNI